MSTPAAAAPGLGRIPPWAPLAGLLGVALAAVTGGSLVAAAFELAGGEVETGAFEPAVLIPATLIQDAALVLVPFLMARSWAAGVGPGDFGLRTVPWRHGMAWAVAVYFGFLAVAALYGVLVGPGPQQDLAVEIQREESLVALAGLALMVGVGAPVAEEVFFRGFLFGVLREKIPVWAAALVAGTLFGVIHVAGSPVRTLGVLIVLGIGLCLLYVKTGSLLPCMALHSFNNAITFVVTTDPASPAVGLLVVVGSVGLTLIVARWLVSLRPASSG